MLVLKGMTEGLRSQNLVLVSAADPLTLQISPFFQLMDDPLNRTNGDADGIRNVSLTQFRITTDSYEHVGVVGEKRPPWKIRFRCCQHRIEITPIQLPISTTA